MKGTPPSPIFEPVFALVDAFRSGAWLPSAFLAHGIRCVHVLSDRDTPFSGTYGGPNCGEFYLDGDHKRLIDELRAFQIIAAIPGSEQGVELADYINEALRTEFNNGVTLSAARRDKRLMRQQAELVGIPQPRFTVVADASAALEAAAHLGPRVVVKPLRGAGAQGVRILERRESILEHVSCLRSGKSMFGDRNTELLVESCLEGDVYIINSVSMHGRHAATDMWRCQKSISEGGAVVFDYMEFVQRSTAIAGNLVAFTERVLDAFDIRYGPAHTEILVSPEGRLFFVEMAARMHGNLDPSMTLRLTGTNQMMETARAYAGSTIAWRSGNLVTDNPWRCRAVDLIAPRSGVLADDLDLGKISSLRSFWSMRIGVKKGSTFTRTSDLLTSPGSIVLCHPDQAAIEEDYVHIRQWEATEYSRLLQ